MCDRYTIQFPPQEHLPKTPDSILEESLALFHPKDVRLHPTAFLIPFEPIREQADINRVSTRGQKKVVDEAAAILRHNIRFMIKRTRNFGLLLSQLTWVGLVNYAEKSRVLQHYEDSLTIAALYIIMLKKEANGLTQFIDCLHMTGNHSIANVIELTLELLMEEFGYCEHSGSCTVSTESSLEESNVHHLPPKKRKTSADSGFDDTDDDEAKEDSESSLPVGGACSRRFECNIKPLDAVDVIAIINGEEDLQCKVELCKCGNYHQFPKWKGANNDRHVSFTNENIYLTSTPSNYSLSMLKHLGRRVSTSIVKSKPNSSLSPVRQPVEMGSDLRNGVDQSLEFTKPRRSCPQLRLRFNSTDDFQEHPDNVEEEQDASSSGESKSNLKSRLPRFLRRLF